MNIQKNIRKAMPAAVILMAAVFSQPAQANDAHGDAGGHVHDHGMQSGGMHGHQDMQAMPGAFMKKAEIDGYTVTFHIMKAPQGKQHGGTHHLMIRVEKDGAPVAIKAANSKSVHPNGQSESKMMMKMGDWYMAAYDLGHSGQHQVMVLFKTSDDAKHFTGIEYPGKDKE